MDAELINPFINATTNVISTMAFTEIAPGKPYVKTTAKTFGQLTGIIGLASPEVQGSMIISFEEKPIVTIVNRMLGETFTEINQDVVDAVGELTNMISGGAKGELSQAGYSFDMATPATILGKDVEINHLASAPILVVPFKMDEGQFVVEANLAKRKG